MSTKNLPQDDLSVKIKFTDISNVLEKLLNAKTPVEKSDIIKKFFDSIGKFKEKFKNENVEAEKLNTSYYSIIRLLVPNKDSTTYGIKAPTMGKLYVRLLGIDKNSEEAKKLMGSVSAGRSNSKTMDYAEVVYSVIKNRFSKSSTITVYEVNKYLESISYHYHSGNSKKIQFIEDELYKMFKEMTSEQQRWIIRIILKSFPFDLRTDKIFPAIHPRAYDVLKKYSNLSRVCEIIDEGNYKLLDEDQIELFSHTHCMRCALISMAQIENKLITIDFFVETKMDGERFQIHIENGLFKYYSRNGYDYTQTFGSNRSEGALTPFLCNNLADNIKNAILDGEMMVWNKERLIYHVKGEDIDVKNIKDDDPVLRPCFVVFDLLFYNDECMLGKPLVERDRLVKHLIKEQQGVIMVSSRNKLRDFQHFVDSLNEAIDKNEEGIVIKETDSKYRPGTRVGWYKIKPDYIDGLGHDFDLTIIGGYYNRHKTFVNEFILGVIDTSSNTENPIFFAFASAAQGLSHADWRKINTQLKPYWNDAEYKKLSRQKKQITNEPSFLKFGNLSPDVWIDPKHSIVLEMRATELIKTSKYATKYSLRFPRIKFIRDDKSFNECCTMQEINSLISNQGEGVQKIAVHYDADNVPSVPKRVKRNPVYRPKPEINTYIQPRNVNKLDNICDGLEFCVLSSFKQKRNLTTQYLTDLIIKHGGKVTANPGKPTFVIIAGDLTPRVQTFIAKCEYNIASVNWLLKALEGDEVKSVLLQFHPSDMIATTMKLDLEFKIKYDKFGDSYTEHLTANDLEKLLTNINIPNFTKLELKSIEDEILGESKFNSIFRPFHGVFYKNSEIQNYDEIYLSCLIFKSRGGSVEDLLSTNHSSSGCYITHIFVDRENLNNKDFKIFLAHLKNVDTDVVKMIDYKWIIACDNSSKVLLYSDYLIQL